MRPHEPPTGDECVFCGSVPVVRSRFINARWDAAYPDHMQFAQEVEHDTFGNQRTKVSDSGPHLATDFNATVRGICAHCRDGWIDALDAEAAPHLKPLFDGNAHQITPAASTIVARWVAMTAVLVEQGQTPRTRPTITPEQGEALRAGAHPDGFLEFSFPLGDGDVLDARSTGLRMGSARGRPLPEGLGDTSCGIVSIMFRRLHVVCLHAANPETIRFMQQARVVELLGQQNQVITQRREPWPDSHAVISRSQAAGFHDEILRRMQSGLRGMQLRHPRA